MKMYIYSFVPRFSGSLSRALLCHCRPLEAERLQAVVSLHVKDNNRGTPILFLWRWLDMDSTWNGLAHRSCLRTVRCVGMNMPLGPWSPTLVSWSSAENMTDRLNVSWAWLLFMMETIFFTTCPGRMAPNFKILLAGSRTKICGQEREQGGRGQQLMRKRNTVRVPQWGKGDSLSSRVSHSSHWMGLCLCSLNKHLCA